MASTSLEGINVPLPSSDEENNSDESDSDFDIFGGLEANEPAQFPAARRSTSATTSNHMSTRSALIPRRITKSSEKYQQKKTFSQGLLDVALVSANANQLKYTMELDTYDVIYYSSLVFIVLSILLQIFVVILLTLRHSLEQKKRREDSRKDEETAKKYNNWATISLGLITIVNIFIAAFGANV